MDAQVGRETREPSLRQVVLVVALLVLPALALLPTAESCGVPCGRIYPLIFITVEEKAAMYNLSQGQTVEVDALLTYKFDMANEGYTVATPNEPIVIRFEYPRKPDWAEVKVEPDVINVDVANPTMVKPDLSTPTSPQASYEFTIPIKISLALTGQAILRDGYDYHKLLVFAKSSESGLYQSGYGIKEFRVVPEGALHEADVAGSRDVFTASPMPALALADQTASFAGTTVSLTTPTDAKWWEPAPFSVAIDPAPASGRMVFAVHDEAGALVASTPPLPAASAAAMNVTLVHPGLHTATLTLLPDAGSDTPPMTYALPFDTADVGAEGFAYPKTMLVTSSETVPAPLLNTADALAQFERDIPFFAFDTAQSASATVTLRSSGLPVVVDRAAINLQFSIHDPDGNLLQAGSVDPYNPTKSIRIGSLPMDGWYVVRLKGVGAPVGGGYDVRIETNYATPHLTRNHADGAADPTGGLLGLAGANLTLPVDALAVWTPSDLTPALDRGAAMRYQLTVYDADGALAYASGLREGAAGFSAPAPGTYRAYVYAEPVLADVPFSPLVRAFTFPVGAGNTTVASTFRIDDGFEAPVAAAASLLGFHAVRVLPGAGAPSLDGGELVDADGNAADGATPGVYYLRAMGAGQPPQGSELRVSLEQGYAMPVTMEGPSLTPAAEQKGLPVPGAGAALIILATVALALVRRRAE